MHYKVTETDFKRIEDWCESQPKGSFYYTVWRYVRNILGDRRGLMGCKGKFPNLIVHVIEDEEKKIRAVYLCTRVDYDYRGEKVVASKGLALIMNQDDQLSGNYKYVRELMQTAGVSAKKEGARFLILYVREKEGVQEAYEEHGKEAVEIVHDPRSADFPNMRLIQIDLTKSKAVVG